MQIPFPGALAEMMELFKTLPGVGKRSAERYPVRKIAKLAWQA